MPGGGVQFLVNWDKLAAKHGIHASKIKEQILDYKSPISGNSGGISWLVDKGYLNRLTSVEGIK